MPDNELRQKSLGEVLTDVAVPAGNSAARAMTQLPSAYDYAARGAEWLANRYLPAPVSGALHEARQFVETNPNVRRHTYADVIGGMARATGLPFGPQPAPPSSGTVMLVPVDHDPFAIKLVPVEHDPFSQAASPKEPPQ